MRWWPASSSFYLLKRETEHLCEMQARQAPRTTSLAGDLEVFPQAAVEDVGSRGCCLGPECSGARLLSDAGAWSGPYH